jgi:hypothetical protein
MTFLSGVQVAVALCSAVDFGPDQDPVSAFYQQRLINAAGASPPFCTEY